METTQLVASYAKMTSFDGKSAKIGHAYLANEDHFDMANEDRITEDTYNQPLTTYITGWRDTSPLVEDLQAIAPSVPVGFRFDYKTHDNAEAFLVDTDDVRAPLADFKRVEYTGSEETGRLDNKGLKIRVLKKATSLTRQRKIQMLTQRLYRSELVRAAKILQGLDAGTAKVWNGTTDPDADLINAVEASADDSGIQPNIAIFDSKAWAMRQLALRASDKAGAFASAAMTKEQIAALIGVERVIVLKERFTKKKGSGNKETLLSNPGVIITNIDQLATEDDPSAVKRFTDEEGDLMVYVEPHNKWDDITVDHSSKIIGTTGIGTKRLNVSAS